VWKISHAVFYGTIFLLIVLFVLAALFVAVAMIL